MIFFSQNMDDRFIHLYYLMPFSKKRLVEGHTETKLIFQVNHRKCVKIFLILILFSVVLELSKLIKAYIKAYNIWLEKMSVIAYEIS